MVPDAAGDRFTVVGRFYTDGKAVTRGSLDRLGVGPGVALTAITVASGSVGRAGTDVTAALMLERGGRRARRGDGSVLKGLQLMWRPSAENGARAPGAARALTVSNDFAPVEEAIESMLKDSIAGRIDAFSDRSFRRASHPALFERLGVPPLDWCCLDTSGMPPPALETHVSAGEATEQATVKPVSLQPFYRYCRDLPSDVRSLPAELPARLPRAGHRESGAMRTAALHSVVDVADRSHRAAEDADAAFFCASRIPLLAGSVAQEQRVGVAHELRGAGASDRNRKGPAAAGRAAARIRESAHLPSGRG